MAFRLYYSCVCRRACAIINRQRKMSKDGERWAMAAVHALPENYTQVFSVDLQKDKKKAIMVNMIAGVIALVLAIPMHFYVPFLTLFDMDAGLPAYVIRFAVLLAAILVYMVLHELVHGVTMKVFGTKKIKYGFTGMYAYAGSDDYYDKKSYIIIALAPVVAWGIFLAIVNMLVPVDWFWVVYLVQITNISGAAGDLYVTVKFSRLPKDILVRDWGVRMAVYAPK